MPIKTIDGIWCCNNADNEYQRIVVDHTGDLGDVDYQKKIIRINKNPDRNGPGEIINTIIHEELHARHPRMSEATICKRAGVLVKTLSAAQKRKLRARYR